MFLKSCRCGQSKKRFYKDLFPFFIGECCSEKGYDEKGNLEEEITSTPATPIDLQSTSATSDACIETSLDVKMDPRKLKYLKICDLKQLAEHHQVPNFSEMTRTSLIDALFPIHKSLFVK